MMFCRSKDKRQISGEGKWRLREAVVNGACFPLCTTVHVTSMYVAKVKNASLPTGYTVPSQHNWNRVSNVSMMWANWYIPGVLSVRYIPGILSVGNMNVHKSLKFSVQGGWDELFNLPFSPPPCFSFSSPRPPPFVNLWLRNYSNCFKLCHFCMSVWCLFLDLHLVTGSRGRGIALH